MVFDLPRTWCASLGAEERHHRLSVVTDAVTACVQLTGSPFEPKGVGNVEGVARQAVMQ